MYLAFLSLNLNKLMDAINKHYNLGMAKLTVQKNNDIESIKEKNKHDYNFFQKVFLC